ncbi:MAG: hydantoinase/oxoprolinase family protein [Methanosarcina sp.]|jgi:N-methylhydantoinase A/oxoprolinase/acetone carboxylase beta subunit|nr:hydantoinase/oxoprolinase family protein [Methanosarcina sp.]MDD3316764.1 hydantoinase/oxoprolinase family protein [Methanosarcina sp.]MDD4307161.1 hydantoinase/oxoprolinase family protein [Methanosarcina sp.]NLN43346.1 hydantoinase/oxoprolinase family protein [Methanosarcina sp.]
MYLGLGIDTGGTYTDVAIMDMSNGTIIESNKALTTYPDLIRGIKNSIEGLDPRYFKRIKFVSVSTTLATNTTLEGKGYPAGLILIGHTIPKKLVNHYTISIQGGHDSSGNEIAPLEDLETIRDFVKQVKNKVAAFAVSGYFGVRNPEHELKVKEIIQEMTGLPVVCGHELSTSLGAYERAVTALLNAELIPVSKQFINSVRTIMQEKEIKATLMMMKCDGSLVSIEEALQKPVESIFSGPAASLVGAAYLTGLDTCVTVDVGGTSTDISMISGGIPEISSSGAKVGDWKTMVKAIRMETSALGGDSLVWIKRKTYLGPTRAIPLCLAASEFPSLLDKLKKIEIPNERIMDEIIQPTSFFIRNKENSPELLTGELEEGEKAILNQLGAEPRSVSELSELTGKHPLMFAGILKNLIRKRHVSQIGFTPTDALHVLGEYLRWNEKASVLGASILGKTLKKGGEEFSAQIKAEVVRRFTLELVSFFASNVKKEELAKLIGNEAFLKFHIKVPVVLVGAPVRAYLKEINEAIDADIRIPAFYEVGNAVGALEGKIIHRTEILIRPSGAGGEEYSVFSGLGKEVFEDYGEALEYGLKLSRRLVSEYMDGYGLEMDNVEFDLKQNDVGSKGTTPMETRLIGIGIGTTGKFI